MHGTIAAIALSAVTGAPGPIIGPPIRIDLGGGTAWANETTGSASEFDPDVIVAGWNDYRDHIRTGFALSFDGGGSWADFLLRPPVPNQSGIEGDPMVAHDDRTGALWAGGISFVSSGGIYVARLDPGDALFGPSVMARVGFVDKGWMAAGPRPGEPDSTRLYCAYNEGAIWSDDMGDSWTEPVSLDYGLGFLPRVGPGGELYVAYWDVEDGVMLKRSTNGGASFTTHTIATRMDVWGVQDGSRFPGVFRVPSINYLEVDPDDGTLYAVYFDTTDMSGPLGSANVDLYFTKSHDQGTSWTTPVVINGDASPPGDQFFPWLEADREGRLHMVFLDSRNTVQPDDLPNGFFDAYYAWSADGGDTWSEHRLTAQSWSSDGVSFIGDYSGMAVSRNRVYPVYIVMDDGDENIYSNAIVFPGDPDLDGNGSVGVMDLLMLLAAWGPCPAPPSQCIADLDGDGIVGVTDLLTLLGAWAI